MKKCLSVLLIALLSSTVNAGVRNSELRSVENIIIEQELPNCKSPKTYYDEVYCSAKIYSILDEELNESYSNARRVINKNQRNALKNVQKKWIRNRDDNCASVTSDSVIMNLTCAKKATLTSIVYLWEIIENPNDFQLY
ncbi:lysozyme inhibitor LprI family protein [Vibrio rarus]|uniref:lysozyme inhibitor LprI family protein n=1 Tax=Vibrio rarus TaxID=413403 RepID=UPI0039E7C6CF